MPTANLWAWNALGHRLIGQIAYDNLDSDTRSILSKYNKLLNSKGRKYSLVDASCWLDTLYADKYKDFRELHYINLPYTVDGSKSPKVHSYNVVFAILMTNSILNDVKTSSLDKALALRILWHVAGDIHQPMHTINLVSKKYPEGDKGGNLFLLPKNKVARNLHSYWDRGAGILQTQKSYNAEEVKAMANIIEKKWPCDKKNISIDPELWAQESYSIAVNYAYKTPFDYKYQKQAQEISLRRIALAGCRLAAISSRHDRREV